MLARDIMTRDVITVSPATTIKNLAKILIQNQISGAPVTDKKGKILGVVSEADIVAKKGKQVKEIMSKTIVGVTDDTPVEEIAALMGLSLNAVSPALIRARQKIRALLEGDR